MIAKRVMRTHPHTLWWLLGSVLLLAGAMPLARAAAQQTKALGPQAVIEQTTQAMLAQLKADRKQLKAHPGRLYALVSDIVLPHFDFVHMAHWVMGRGNWAQMSRAQKTQFVLAFRTLLVRTYGTALLQYTNQKIRFLPLRDDPAQGYVVVRSQVMEGNGRTIGIFYSLYNRRGEWLVYDISIDGISLLTNYRSSFNDEINRYGIKGLIARLEQHNAKRAGP